MLLREKIHREVEAFRKACELHAHHLKTVQSITHLTYFGLVVLHGPYHWPAAVCFTLGIVIVVARLDLEV